MAFDGKWGRLILFLALGISSVAAADPARRDLELELDEIPGTTGYEIRVTRTLPDHTKKPPVVFKIKGVKWSAKLLPGHYEMEVRSLDSRHVPGPWSPPQDLVVKLPAVEQIMPPPSSTIHSDDNKLEKVSFEWKAVEGAERYRLKIFNKDGSVLQETIETGLSSKVKLPVAREYAWSVTPMMEGDTEGDAPEKPPVFSVVGAKIDPPRILPVDEINTTEFNWGPSENANNYDFILESKGEDGRWSTYMIDKTSGNRFVSKKPLPSGRYRVRMIAHGTLRVDSEPSTAEFKTLYVNTRSPAAIEQVKTETSYETKSIMFGLASYYVTFVNYVGNNNDYSQPTNTTFNAIGGTGRLGLGTWFKEDSKIGLMTTGDLSGYTINNNTSTYYSQSLQGVYRERLGALGQLRLNFGAQYRQLPCTIGNQPGTQSTFQSSITTLGPLGGATLSHGFTRKLGMQLNAQVAQSSFGFQTPNGQTNVPAMSYQLGILGSLNLGPKLVGFVGYAYRDELAKYNSVPGTSSSGGTNTSEISGHYINLLMEYGF